MLATGRRRLEVVRERRSEPCGGPERTFFVVVLAAALAITLVRIGVASQAPVVSGDEAIIYAAKAKALYVAGGLGTELSALAEQGRQVRHRDYPILNPLLQLWAFVLGGGILHHENRWPVAACAVALVLLLASALRRRLRDGFAAPLLLVVPGLLLLRTQSAKAGADLMVALGLVVGVDALLRWREDGHRAIPALAGLGFAFALWSKNDAVLHVGALGFGALVFLRRFRPLPRSALAWLLAPGLLVLTFTMLSNALLGFESEFLGGDRAVGQAEAVRLEFGERLAPIARFFARNLLLDPAHDGLLGLLLLLGCALFPRRLALGELAPLTWALVAGTLGLALVYAVPTYELEWHLATSAERAASQAVPLLPLDRAGAGGAPPGRGEGLQRGLRPPAGPFGPFSSFSRRIVAGSGASLRHGA
jgi:hypothetical protein